MKILITGANGMLGKDIAETFKKKHSLILTGRDNLDISDLEWCKDFINHAKPDLIINCAAYTMVDKCEEQIELAFRVNAFGPRNLAIICNDQDIPLVQISTDYVFDGAKGVNYFEDDIKNPLSIYGKSKSLAEDYITALTNKFYIIRTSWLFGENGNSFIKTMLQLGRTKDSITIVKDQFGRPTYTKDLAQAVATLIEEPRYGMYHITNSGYTNWYEYAKYIFSLVDYKVTVKSISSEELCLPATRPKYSVLENRLWKLEGFSQLRSYKEAVKEYVENYLNREETS